MKALFSVLFLTFLILEELSFTVADLQQENSNEKGECNGYCFSIFKPVLDHFVQLKQSGDKNDELKGNINTMEKTIKDLQSQLEMNEKLLNVKNEQISSLRNQISSIETTLSAVSNQLSECRKTDVNLKISESTVKIKDEISDLKIYIESIKKTISERYDRKENLPETCPSGGSNGIYELKPRGMESFKVPCVSPAPGWTVIQRRFDGSEDFNRTWADYKNGFGDIKGEFFIGLEKMYLLTKTQPYELYINLGKVDGSSGYARYDDFKIGSEADSYELKSLGEYSGTAGDSLKNHKNIKFSTTDRDNDQNKLNCAKNHGGGWWFIGCAYSFLNGKFFSDGKRESVERHGIYWGSFHSYDYQMSLTFVEMMIRPKSL